jgi:hypothetical protein
MGRAFDHAAAGFAGEGRRAPSTASPFTRAAPQKGPDAMNKLKSRS